MNSNNNFKPSHGEICVLAKNHSLIFSFNAHGDYPTSYIDCVYVMSNGEIDVTNYEGDNHACVGYNAPIEKANSDEVALFNKYVKKR